MTEPQRQEVAKVATAVSELKQTYYNDLSLTRFDSDFAFAGCLNETSRGLRFRFPQGQLPHLSSLRIKVGNQDGGIRHLDHSTCSIAISSEKNRCIETLGALIVSANPEYYFQSNEADTTLCIYSAECTVLIKDINNRNDEYRSVAWPLSIDNLSVEGTWNRIHDHVDQEEIFRSLVADIGSDTVDHAYVRYIKTFCLSVLSGQYDAFQKIEAVIGLFGRRAGMLLMDAVNRIAELLESRTFSAIGEFGNHRSVQRPEMPPLDVLVWLKGQQKVGMNSGSARELHNDDVGPVFDTDCMGARWTFPRNPFFPFAYIYGKSWGVPESAFDPGWKPSLSLVSAGRHT
jgi:hypothetical protein